MIAKLYLKAQDKSFLEKKMLTIKAYILDRIELIIRFTCRKHNTTVRIPKTICNSIMSYFSPNMFFMCIK